MNVIFGNNRYAELVLKALEDKSGFEIDAFVVDKSFLSMEHLPVKQIAFEDFKTENSNVFIGFTFENKKGPSFLRAIVNRFSHLSCNFPGFNLASNSGKVDFGRGSQHLIMVFDFDCKKDLLFKSDLVAALATMFNRRLYLCCSRSKSWKKC